MGFSGRKGNGEDASEYARRGRGADGRRGTAPEGEPAHQNSASSISSSGFAPARALRISAAVSGSSLAK